MKKTSIVVLILVLLIVPMLSLHSCEKEEVITTVGVVEYVKSGNIHSIYLRPLDHDKNSIWIPINVSEDTETISTFNKDLSKMPELSVGSIIEVTYKISEPNDKLLFGYNAISVKSSSKTAMTDSQETPLRLTEGYHYTNDALGGTNSGTVVHVARIETPASGYLIYLEDALVANGKLAVYFIDDEAAQHDKRTVFLDNEIKNKIQKFETGYKITVVGSTQQPFGAIDIESVLYVSMYNSY